MATPRPHLLGIDDAPFEKGQHQSVPIVAVMMEGSDLVETTPKGVRLRKMLLNEELRKRAK